MTQMLYQGRRITVPDPVTVAPPVDLILAGLPERVRETLRPILTAAPVIGVSIGDLDDLSTVVLQFAGQVDTPTKEAAVLALAQASRPTDALVISDGDGD